MELLRKTGKRLTTRSAFTLVELLVVIAIIGVLVGLLLRPCRRLAKPRDVSNARTISSRLAWLFTCTTTLRQNACRISTNQQSANPDQAGWGWATKLLPFIEQGPLYDSLAPSKTNRFRQAVRDPAKLQLLRTPIATYRCPSDTATLLIPIVPWTFLRPGRSSHVKLHRKPGYWHFITIGWSLSRRRGVEAQRYHRRFVQHDPRGRTQFSRYRKDWARRCERLGRSHDYISRRLCWNLAHRVCCWPRIRFSIQHQSWEVYFGGTGFIPAQAFTSLHHGIAQFVFTDGSVHAISESIDSRLSGQQNYANIGTFQKLSARNDGLTIGEW